MHLSTLGRTCRFQSLHGSWTPMFHGILDMAYARFSTQVLSMPHTGLSFSSRPLCMLSDLRKRYKVSMSNVPRTAIEVWPRVSPACVFACMTKYIMILWCVHHMLTTNGLWLTAPDAMCTSMFSLMLDWVWLLRIWGSARMSCDVKMLNCDACLSEA